MNNRPPTWTDVCAGDAILTDTGVWARVDGQHVAVFCQGGDAAVFHTIANVDPRVGARVLSRGLQGNPGHHIVVASPRYKNHFDRRTGECLEAPEHAAPARAVRAHAGRVHVAPGFSTSCTLRLWPWPSPGSASSLTVSKPKPCV